MFRRFLILLAGLRAISVAKGIKIDDGNGTEASRPQEAPDTTTSPNDDVTVTTLGSLRGERDREQGREDGGPKWKTEEEATSSCSPAPRLRANGVFCSTLAADAHVNLYQNPKETLLGLFSIHE
jgi:hypothetical protein